MRTAKYLRAGLLPGAFPSAGCAPGARGSWDAAGRLSSRLPFTETTGFFPMSPEDGPVPALHLDAASGVLQRARPHAQREALSAAHLEEEAGQVPAGRAPHDTA